jgi:hypothetical protein
LLFTLMAGSFWQLNGLAASRYVIASMGFFPSHGWFVDGETTKSCIAHKTVIRTAGQSMASW